MGRGRAKSKVAGLTEEARIRLSSEVILKVELSM
jgi:hypothetical protein